MGLQTQLDDLRRQRDQELRTLNWTYARSKRELKRAVSPGRIIRRHLGISVVASAIAGFLLAPRPTPRQPRTTAAASRVPAWLGNLIHSVIPQQLARYIPGLTSTDGSPQEQSPSTDHAQSPSKRRPTLLKFLLTLVFFVLRNGRMRRLLINAIRNRRRSQRYPEAADRDDAEASGAQAEPSAAYAAES